MLHRNKVGVKLCTKAKLRPDDLHEKANVSLDRYTCASIDKLSIKVRGVNVLPKQITL